MHRHIPVVRGHGFPRIVNGTHIPAEREHDSRVIVTLFVVRWHGDDDAVPALMSVKTLMGITAKKSGGG